MTAPAASVVIASHGRPGWLRQALTSLRYQVNATFEVIVVADSSGIAALGDPWPARFIPFDEQNLSRARNIGIAATRAPIVAFLDDDAVAFPMWLLRLTAPMKGGVGWSTGPVRRDNGWKIEWKPSHVNELGEDIDILDEGDFPRCPLKAIGTNMAFDRTALLAAGGFDESLRFFMEDADISWVLHRVGRWGGISGAEVMHGFAPGPLRRRHRVPKSLFEIGASRAHFLKKHAAPDAFAEAWQRFAEAQCRRLLRHMLVGRLDPFDVPRLMKTLEAGREDGMRRVPRHALSARSGEQGAVEPAPLWPSATEDAFLIDPRKWPDRAFVKAAHLAGEGVPVLFGPVKAWRPYLRFRLVGVRTGFWEWSAGRTLPAAPPPWLLRQFLPEE